MTRTTLAALTWLTLITLAGGEGLGQESPRAPELLQKFDVDGDGKLDAGELERALATRTREELDFLRVQRDATGTPAALQTAIISFRSDAKDQQVDLIGAIHVGDKAYYEQLNRIFREYDVVLYELIAPEGTRVPRGGQVTDHPVGRLQRSIKSLLDLSFQLDEIDYTADHLVHADMSPQQFADSMEERGESFLQILFRLMGQASAQAGRDNGPSDRDLFMALFASDRPLRLKRILADQFENLEGQMSMLEGPNGSTLITQRNKRALEVLAQQHAAGRVKVGIFYGAGHMSDMAARLQDDFQLRPSATRWLTAWDMTGTNAGPQP